MNRHTQARLVDDAVDAYVHWREACATVRDAYERWDRASAADFGLASAAYRAVAFMAYQAAVDREECAADSYAMLMGRLAAACPLGPTAPPNAALSDRNRPDSST